MAYERDFGGIPYRARQIETADDGAITWFIEYDQEKSGRFERRATFIQKDGRFFLGDLPFRDIDDVMIRYYYGDPR